MLIINPYLMVNNVREERHIRRESKYYVNKVRQIKSITEFVRLIVNLTRREKEPRQPLKNVNAWWAQANQEWQQFIFHKHPRPRTPMVPVTCFHSCRQWCVDDRALGFDDLRRKREEDLKGVKQNNASFYWHGFLTSHRRITKESFALCFLYHDNLEDYI